MLCLGKSSNFGFIDFISQSLTIHTVRIISLSFFLSTSKGS
jgi:hypothetical protein